MSSSSGPSQTVLRIVYCGPSESGKTTNLESLSRLLPPQFGSKLVKLATETERTLYFDLLTIHVRRSSGQVPIRLELFTVPGQNFYLSARRRVLREANGIVFVADSRRERLEANIESLGDIVASIQDSGRDVDEMPAVLQLNKIDEPTAIPREDLLLALGCEDEPFVEAVASQGRGVVETLRLIWQYSVPKRLMVEPTF